MRKVWISDDRGRRVPLCGPGDLGPEAGAYVRLRVGRANGHRGQVVVLLCMATASVVGVVALHPFRARSSHSLAVDVAIQLTSIGLVAAIGIPLAWLHAVRRGARLARAECLAQSICPSCGYALTGLALEADGCAVCPECSNAWRPVRGSET